jgi:tape measure domain-containing protein
MAAKGVELASAYISLSVSVDDVPEQIEKAFKGSSKTAERAGRDIGKQVSRGASAGISDGAMAKALAKELGSAGDRGSKEILRSLASVNTQASKEASVAGRNYARAMAAAITSGGSRDAARQYEAQFRNALNAKASSQAYFDEFHRDGVERGRRVGTLVGKAVGGAMTLAVGAATAGVTAAVGGIGYTLFKGFERYKSIDATANRLRAMGKSGDQVRSIMGDLTSVVQGTPIALDEAADAATKFLSGGVKEGQELNGIMTAIADAAGASGANFSDLATIFGQVMNKGKFQAEEMNQLNERGINIQAALRDEFGWTADELTKMSDEGTISFQHLVDAVDGKFGGMAKKMGDTIDGALGNMQTAVARVGANFISAIFGDPLDTTEGPGGMAQAINRVTEKIDGLNQWVTTHQGEIKQFFTDAAETARNLAEKVKDVATFLKEHPGLIKTVVGAFVAWKTIEGVSALITSLKTISGLLRTDIPEAAGKTKTSLSSALIGPGAAVIAGSWGIGELQSQMDTFFGTNFFSKYGNLPGSAAWLFNGGLANLDFQVPDWLKSPSGPGPTGTTIPQGQGPAANATQGDALGPGFFLGDKPNSPGSSVPPFLQNFLNRNGGATNSSTGGNALGADFFAPSSGGGQSVVLPKPQAAQTYGLPAGTNTGGYGTGTGKTFPPWVMQIADAFGIKPSTYAGHQESNRNEPGYAPNPQGLNRGIDWSGPVENMQRFADYLRTVPGLEQVIWQNPNTGSAVEIAGGKPQPGYFSGDLAGHQNHVHTRQATPIPLPPWAVRRASGGSVNGPGTSRSDSIPAYLSNGEHVLNARDVAAMGGQAGVYAFRNALHRRNGGAIKSGQAIFPRKPNRGPGNTPGTIGLPDWGTPGQGWGTPPPGWWLKPVNPDDVLFPEWWGQNPWGKHPLDKDRFRPFGFAEGGAVDFVKVMEQWAALEGVSQQHGLGQGQPPGPVGAEPMMVPPGQGGPPADALPAGTGRTEGFIPAGAGFSGKTGGGLVGGLIAMGGEAAKGAIQLAADVGKMAASAAASAGTMGAGAAAGPAAGAGIQLGADMAKRGVDYGVEMAGIGVGFLGEQLFPFGAPRWLSDVDPTAFIPNMGGGSLATTAAEAVAAGAGPGMADPNAVQHGQGMGAPPGPVPPPNPLGVGAAAGTPINAGKAPTPAPAPPPPPGPANPNPSVSPQNDPATWLKSLGIFDNGGVLPPRGAAVNLSNRPEYVFNESQWKTMESHASRGGGGSVTYNVMGKDLDDALREMKKHERRQSGPTMRGKAGLG